MPPRPQTTANPQPPAVQNAVANQKANDDPSLDAATAEALEVTLDELVTRDLSSPEFGAELAASAAELYTRCMAAKGRLEPLDEVLTAKIAAEEGPGRAVALSLSAHLSWRHGDLDRALADFEAVLAAAGEARPQYAELARAELLDALGRSKEALAAYGELVPRLERGDLATRLRLRMALMSMESRDEAQKDALATFAREDGQTLELRNRAAIVLGLLGRPGDAADLYVVPDLDADPRASGSAALEGEAPHDASGDEDGELEEGASPDDLARARKAAAHGELRVAEWALAAKDYARAGDAAWRAVHLAPVARERRYALTLLAEAHRSGKTLPALLERFATERASLPAEARRTWIELLRETGSYDDAIALSSGAEAAAFSRDERRRMLELFREAGRTDLMLAEYAASISAEPLELTWREGLARHHLEQGDREAARAVFEDWFEAAGRAGLGTLGAARSLELLGLDELAVRGAEESFEAGREPEAALLFLFELYLDRGRLDDARASLSRLDTFAPAGSPVRMQLSDCLERLGDLEGALRALEGVRAARPPGGAGEDLEMRLAWLYSEVGREEQALELWRDLWTRVKSVARMRFVEDRLMTVASRLGVLADVAVELEEKLYNGTADQKDSGLLVRLYSKVGDAVSATEVIDEFLRRTGGTEVEALTEKARIYLSCNDYYHYERAVRRLLVLDPPGRGDYLRQLAMSQLERGKPDEARETLMQLGDEPGDDSAAEFEAGVLALSGLREEAISAYRRGLAGHPERIDSYLLMANLMKEVRQSDRAVGMFQFLAEHADGDDAFTIAIDGLLNMLVDAPPRPKMVEWARRITLERLAARADAPYLYQLLADLADETTDHEGQIRALASSLAAAGPRRASVLRELMDLSKPAARAFNAAARKGDRSQQLAFGRRLVGLGELVPPEVFLDLGDAFLEAGDEGSASRTFDLTREFPDGELYQRQSAERFERANYTERALDRYRAVLAASPTDVPLLVKVAELREQLGDDPGAHALYRRAYDLLLSRKGLIALAKDTAEDPNELRRYGARNVDDFDQQQPRALEGLLATAPSAEAVRAFLGNELETLRGEVALAGEMAAREPAAGADPGDAPGLENLAQHPRLVARVDALRRVGAATDAVDLVEQLDRLVIAAFPTDDACLWDALESRARWGRVAAARALLATSGHDEATRRKFAARLGGSAAVDETGPLALAEAVASIVPALADGELEVVRRNLRRVDLGSVPKAELDRIGVLFAAARYIGDLELALRIGRDWVRLSLAQGGYPYQVEQQVEGILAGLDTETGLALARYFVGRVLEDPTKNAQYVTLLPKLAQSFEESVVDSEQVRTLLDGYGQTYAFGLGPVLTLLPGAERAGAVRSVWGKLEAANRADFLVDLVVQSTEEVPTELAAFVRESLPGVIGEAQDFFRYSAAQLLDLDHSHALAIDIARAIEEARPEYTFLAAVRAIHGHALGREEALTEGAEAWAALVGADTDQNYELRNAYETLQTKLLPEGRAAFEAALAKRAAEVGASPQLAKARVELAVAAEDEEAARVALVESLSEFPEDLDLWRLKRERLQRLGERIAAAEALEVLVSLSKDEAEKKRLGRQLVGEWERLHAPERALVAHQLYLADGEAAESSIPGLPAGFVLPAGAMIVVGGVAYSGDDVSSGKRKPLPRTFKDALTAFEEGRSEEGALILRRLWRQFPIGQPRANLFGGRRYRGLPLATLTLPTPKSVDTEVEAPRRGGLLSYEPVPSAPRLPGEKAHGRLVEWPLAEGEMRRFLRTVDAFELDRLQDLLEGLLAGRVEALGQEAVAQEILERVADGRGGRADQIQLLGLFDSAPELLDARASEALAGMVSTIPPRDAQQVRRLARVRLRGGEEEEALRLYRWCAMQAGGGSMVTGESEDVVSYVSDRDLVREAREHLTGDAQIELIELVLDASRPTDRPWAVESYEMLVLDTWSEVLGPREALARSRELCDGLRDPGQGLRRRASLRAAQVYLAAGEEALALEALELGLAKIDPARVRQPDEVWYRVDPKQPGRLGVAELRRLLPVRNVAPPAGDALEGEGAGVSPGKAAMDVTVLERPAEWFSAFATTLEGWLTAERVDVSNTVEALALAGVRLHEAGRAEEARALVSRLAVRTDLDAGTRLWVIDALRQVGDELGARLEERRLLAEGRLHPERVEAVCAWILEDEGPEAALAAAQPYSGVMRQPELLELLATAASGASEPDAAAAWRAAGDAARSAEAELKAARELPSGSRP